MIILDPRNVNYALPMGVDLIHREGIREPSRNGDVLRVPVPVTTIYAKPTERVLLHHWRDANPFFHLIEAMWMLAGRNDLKALTPYVARMKEYSDDGGVTMPGAYGKRWRGWFGITEVRDQLDWVVKRLRNNQNDRRTVIQMWDAHYDMGRTEDNGKDVPCNLTALPWVSEGALHLTVFCRSNDMIWGAYGANAVHFSFLLEYLAGRIGIQVGKYYQISNNFHAYVDNAGDPQACWPSGWTADPYAAGWVKPYSMWTDWEHVDINGIRDQMMMEDLLIFFEHGWREAATKARWPFLRRVVVPMAAAHEHYKKTKGDDRFTGAIEIVQQCVASDWHLAAYDWFSRRQEDWQNKQ